MKRALVLIVSLALLVVGLGLVITEHGADLQARQKKGQLLDKVVDRIDQVVPPAQPAPRKLIAERVELPNDLGKCWLTFVYAPGWQSDPETVRLHNMWLTDRRLVECRHNCRVHSFAEGDTPVRQKWLQYVGENSPTLTLQTPQGKLIYKASRGTIPANADAMVGQLQAAINNCFRRPCPQPEPAPAPQPAPNVAPVNPLPDTVPTTNPLPADDGADPAWLLVAVGALGAVGGVALGRKRK